MHTYVTLHGDSTNDAVTVNRENTVPHASWYLSSVEVFLIEEQLELNGSFIVQWRSLQMCQH